MSKPHKHAELIKAWADGAIIQEKYSFNDWRVFDGHWQEEEDYGYRIKPEPKPDVVRYVTYEWNPMTERTYGGMPDQKQSLHANLKLTFDGETGKLKAAEIIND